MKTSSNWLYKYILGFSIFFSLLNAALEVVVVFFRESFSYDLLVIAGWLNFKSFELQYMTGRIFDFTYFVEEGSYGYSGSFLDYAFALVFLVGTAFYWVSKGKSKRILIFCYSILFMMSVITFVEIGQEFFEFFELSLLLFVALMKYSILMFISGSMVASWIKERLPKELTLNSENEHQETAVVTASKAQKVVRLSNLLLDTFFIVILFSYYVFRSRHEWVQTLSNILPDSISGSVIFAIFATFYYLIFEGIFRTTPAKILTNSVVTLIDQKKTEFVDVLIRTLCRRIPFDAISYFGRTGWHDALSETTVIKLEKEEKKYVLAYRIILVLIVIGLLACVYFENRNRW